jgi:hypothetical protein
MATKQNNTQAIKNYIDKISKKGKNTKHGCAKNIESTTIEMMKRIVYHVQNIRWK